MAVDGGISISEYARRRGVSDKAVGKAIAAGKIVNGVTGRGTKRPKILPEIADAEWAANHNPNYSRTTKGGEQMSKTLGKPTTKKASEKPQDPPPGDQAEEQMPVDAAQDGMTYNSIKTQQARLTLHLKALEFRKKKGELVDKSQVYTALFNFGLEVKAAILAVPDRTIDLILAAPSRNEAHNLLTDALILALEALADTATVELDTTKQ